MRGLYELKSGENKHKIGVNVFGGDSSVQSRAFTWFIAHIFDNYAHLVTNNLEWWFRNGFFKESAEGIEAKMRSYGYDAEEKHTNMVAFFIDCNCL